MNNKLGSVFNNTSKYYIFNTYNKNYNKILYNKY